MTIRHDCMTCQYLKRCHFNRERCPLERVAEDYFEQKDYEEFLLNVVYKDTQDYWEAHGIL